MSERKLTVLVTDSNKPSIATNELKNSQDSLNSEAAIRLTTQSKPKKPSSLSVSQTADTLEETRLLDMQAFKPEPVDTLIQNMTIDKDEQEYFDRQRQKSAVSQVESEPNTHDRQTSNISLSTNTETALDATKMQLKFKKLFPELNNADETITEVFNCAYDKGILWQGKLFLTFDYIAFYSKIFGKTKKIVLLYGCVASIEKKSTAGLIPNAIKIITKESKQYTFSSFLNRDDAYTEIFNHWKSKTLYDPKLIIEPPSLESSMSNLSTKPELLALSLDSKLLASQLNKVKKARPKAASLSPVAESSGGSKAASMSDLCSSNEELSNALKQKSAENSKDDLILKDEHKRVKSKPASSRTTSMSASMNDFFKRVFTTTEKEVLVASLDKDVLLVKSTPSSSPSKLTEGTASTSTGSPTTAKSKSTDSISSSPVSCQCKSHPGKHLITQMFNIPVEELWLEIFGDAKAANYVEALKSRGSESISVSEWKTNDQSLLERELKHQINLKVPVFGKQSSPSVNTLIVISKEDKKRYVVEDNSRTPKVPYGDTFVAINRYCLTSEGEGKSKASVYSRVEFNKKVIWKSQIESGAYDGSLGMAKAIFALIAPDGKAESIKTTSTTSKRDSIFGKIKESETTDSIKDIDTTTTWGDLKTLALVFLSLMTIFNTYLVISLQSQLSSNQIIPQQQPLTSLPESKNELVQLQRTIMQIQQQLDLVNGIFNQVKDSITSNESESQ